MASNRSIWVIGMGPGDPAYLLPVAREKACQCEVLVGACRWLQLLDQLEPSTSRIKIELTGDLDKIIEMVKDCYSHCRIGFLVSGDPGVYSLLGRLRLHFAEEELGVIPGISSVQYLVSRLKRPWHDCCIISRHGRNNDDLLEAVRRQPVVVLTDERCSPDEIARFLIKKGVMNKKVYVGSWLSWPQEQVVAGSLEYIGSLQFKEMSVMLIEDGD